MLFGKRGACSGNNADRPAGVAFDLRAEVGQCRAMVGAGFIPFENKSPSQRAITLFQVVPSHAFHR